MGHYLTPGGPVMKSFRCNARGSVQTNPDRSRESLDLQEEKELSGESEQSMEQDRLWTADRHATGSRRDDMPRNIRLVRVTLEDVASRKGAQAVASQAPLNGASKRSKNSTARPQDPTRTPLSDPLAASVGQCRHVGRFVGFPRGKLQNIPRPPPPLNPVPRRDKWLVNSYNL